MLCSFVARLEVMPTVRESSKGHTACRALSPWLTGSDYPLSPLCPEQESPSREDFQHSETLMGLARWQVPSPRQDLSPSQSFPDPTQVALICYSVVDPSLPFRIPCGLSLWLAPSPGPISDQAAGTGEEEARDRGSQIVFPKNFLIPSTSRP